MNVILDVPTTEPLGRTALSSVLNTNAGPLGPTAGDNLSGCN